MQWLNVLDSVAGAAFTGVIPFKELSKDGLQHVFSSLPIEENTLGNCLYLFGSNILDHCYVT